MMHDYSVTATIAGTQLELKGNRKDHPCGWADDIGLTSGDNMEGIAFCATGTLFPEHIEYDVGLWRDTKHATIAEMRATVEFGYDGEFIGSDTKLLGSLIVSPEEILAIVRPHN